MSEKKTLLQPVSFVTVLLALLAVVSAESKEWILVSLSGEQSTALVDGKSFETIRLLQVPLGPHEIAVSPDGNKAYVAISGAGPSGEPGRSVAAIDLRTWSVQLFEKDMCQQPHDMRVSRDSRLLWVACGPAKAVLEMDANSGELRKSWNTNVDGGWFVEITPDNQKLLVPHLEGKSLSIINRTNGKVNSIAFAGSLGGIDISPDGREAWMTLSEKPETLSIAIVNTETETVIQKLDIGSPGFGRLIFTPDGKKVVLANGKEALIIDSITREIISRIALPVAVKVLTVSRDGKRAFLTSPATNEVVVVNLLTKKVETSFKTGKNPDGIACIG